MLTERLHRRRGARLAAGDAVLELAETDASGRVPLRVEAHAGEREAHRLRAGLPARLTVEAVPREHTRQVQGVVTRVSPAPNVEGWWIVEIDPNLSRFAPARDSRGRTRLRSAALRPGLTVEIAVEERQETLLRTALDGIAAYTGRTLP